MARKCRDPLGPDWRLDETYTSIRGRWHYTYRAIDGHGQIVDAYPDLVMSHTATWRSVSVMEKVGATKLFDPDRIAIVLDHALRQRAIGPSNE